MNEKIEGKGGEERKRGREGERRGERESEGGRESMSMLFPTKRLGCVSQY